MIKSRISGVLLICSFILSGCGYTTSSLLPAELDSIHVDNFKNQIDVTKEISDKRSNYSYRPGLENTVTTSVINKFIFDNNLDVRSEEKSAMLLKGALVDFQLVPLSYDRDEDVEEFRVEIFVDMELYNQLTGKLMWKESRFMGEYSYNTTGPNSMSESTALTNAVSDLSTRIVERVVEAW
ncbi:MAG: LPS assembly lipoprotein LptE [Candidatus Omnitrophota bacterium]